MPRCTNPYNFQKMVLPAAKRLACLAALAAARPRVRVRACGDWRASQNRTGVPREWTELMILGGELGPTGKTVDDYLTQTYGKAYAPADSNAADLDYIPWRCVGEVAYALCPSRRPGTRPAGAAPKLGSFTFVPHVFSVPHVGTWWLAVARARRRLCPRAGLAQFFLKETDRRSRSSGSSFPGSRASGGTPSGTNNSRAAPPWTPSVTSAPWTSGSRHGIKPAIGELPDARSNGTKTEGLLSGLHRHMCGKNSTPYNHVSSIMLWRTKMEFAIAGASLVILLAAGHFVLEHCMRRNRRVRTVELPSR